MRPETDNMRCDITAEDLISNLYQYFMLEKQRQKPLVSYDRVYHRICTALKLTYSQVYKVINKSSTLGVVSKSKPGRKHKLDSFDKSVIRRAVHKLYERKIPPTCSKIKDEIKDTINVSNATLIVALVEMGFRYTKRGDDRAVFREKYSILSMRSNYLRSVQEYRNLGFQFVFLDETWCNKNHSTDRMWLPSDCSSAPVLPSGKGRRLIILHAGTRSKGLIEGCDLVFEAKKSEGDYHSEMNGQVFLEWFEHQLLPQLDEPSVIILDNASYHNLRVPGTITPTMANLKAQLQEFLTACNVPYRQSETKAQLMEKIRQHKKPIQYITDELAAKQGHIVLRTPVRHCELNPIELIWGNCKNFVARNNTTFKLSDVKDLVYASFARITPEVWQKAEDHVSKIEAEYRQRDGVNVGLVKPVVIPLDSSSSDNDS